MLKSGRFEQEYSVAPRKLIKLNVAESDDYNEFKGEMCEEAPPAIISGRQKEVVVKFQNAEEEMHRNKDVFAFIKTATRKSRKVEVEGGSTLNKQSSSVKKSQEGNKEMVKKQVKDGTKPTSLVKQEGVKVQVKLEEGATIESKPKKIKVKVPPPSGSSNWSAFKQLSTQLPNSVAVPSTKGRTECVALDCEFVKSGDKQLLARVSLVTEGGKCLLDSYVRPSEKITDYLSDISGITYTHIKNAPDQQTVIAQAKKIMYNKIVVGHTVWKDLEVCGLSHWKGYKSLIDINDYAEFKETNGKLVSLKNLAARKLGKQIQDGRHSSVQDAETTLALFNLRKREILKQYKVIL